MDDSLCRARILKNLVEAIVGALPAGVLALLVVALHLDWIVHARRYYSFEFAPDGFVLDVILLLESS